MITMERKTNDQADTRCIAFAGSRRIASGELSQVALAVKNLLERDPEVPVLIFDDTTSERVEVDLRGTPDEIRNRFAPTAQPQRTSPGPGRPKLGVVAREVTLLPRHWEWLNQQPGGASVALRKLVEEARRANSEKDRIRQAQEASYRFLSVMAGDRPGFEEATRALFAGDRKRFDEQIASWPTDIQDHAKKLATDAFPAE